MAERGSEGRPVAGCGSGKRVRPLGRDAADPQRQSSDPDATPSAALDRNRNRHHHLPGGAFHYLAIDKEGSDIAAWLNTRGVAAFVLRYRVVPTPDDESTLRALTANPTPFRPQMDEVRPMVIDDGVQAVRRVRQLADRFGISSNQTGILGFSAGAYAAIGAAAGFPDESSRPDFAAGIYGEWWHLAVPPNAPPLFLTAASNDPLIDIRASTQLYDAWYAAGRSIELHLFARGGHGFALQAQGLPADAWSERFWAWLQAEGFALRKEDQ